MAESYAHKFGQLIGELLETVMRPSLEEFCQSEGLYLDYQKRERPAREGKKVSWQDKYGNIHDLDFVIEKEGNDLIIGQPIAFIEVAWRRYTKHSRNKAQEIQGAILPLAEKYYWNNPFLGAILAGEFTQGSLDQLLSMGFQVLYFPYVTIVEAYRSQGIEILFDESTPDSEFKICIETIINTNQETLNQIKDYLTQTNSNQINQFLSALRNRFSRSIQRVIVRPLYGRSHEFASINLALSFLNGHALYEGSGEFYKYEIRVEFSNSDKVEAFLSTKQQARDFLQFIITQ